MPEETAAGEIGKEQTASNNQPQTWEMASGCLLGWDSAALSISDPFIIVSFIKEATLEMERVRSSNFLADCKVLTFYLGMAEGWL